ncbi:MAG: ribonuclease P protein component 4 [Petrotogales bacterium]
MPRRYAGNKRIQKRIAKNRIQRLFRLAEKYALRDRLELSDRYVFLARKLSMRYLVPIPKEFKRRFCKHCYSYLLPGINCRVRIHRGKIVTYCYNCKKYTRIPLRNI